MLNINCANDCSDEDCNKCCKRGIILRCPPGCEFFEDSYCDMPYYLKEQRDKLMKKLKESNKSGKKD